MTITSFLVLGFSSAVLGWTLGYIHFRARLRKLREEVVEAKRKLECANHQVLDLGGALVDAQRPHRPVEPVVISTKRGKETAVFKFL